MMIAFLISLFGFAFAHRTLKGFIQRKLFAQNEMTKIGTALFAVVITLLIAMPRSHLSLWAAIFAPIAVTSIALLFAVGRRSTAFRNRMRESVTLMSLKMKAGRSFRQALMEVSNDSDRNMRAKLTEITGVVVFSQQKREQVDSFVAEVIEEFIAIDRQPHAALRRLGVFREKLRIEDDFRRRSGQVLSRIRAQSLIMTGLYVANLLFIIWKFGWHANTKVILSSALLYSAGALWIWRGGENIKWKV